MCVPCVGHFGHFKNLELPKRGIYCVSVGIFFGDSSTGVGASAAVSGSGVGATGATLQPIAPHGCFSAPMKHSSYVGDYELPAAPAIDMCEIQNNGEESYFCTRTFIIRYRDECHEINEGAHWRVTVPNFDLALLDWQTHAISCTELLTLRFNLYHCDLCDVTPASDLMHNLPQHLVISLIYYNSLNISRYRSLTVTVPLFAYILFALLPADSPVFTAEAGGSTVQSPCTSRFTPTTGGLQLPPVLPGQLHGATGRELGCHGTLRRH